ncbi:MAG: phage baseplate assembly protein V [Bradymonadaceae bacterium]
MGQLAAQIRELQQQMRQLREGTVQDARISSTRRHIEVNVTLAPSGQEVWAELLQGVGGSSGGTIRVPAEGDSVLVALIDGEPSQGFVLGWLADPSTPLPLQIEKGTTYVWAPANEELKIVTAQGEPALTLKPTGEVVVEADTVRLGSEAAFQAVALASKVESELTEIKTRLWNHTHSAPSGATGPPQPGLPKYADDVGSETVKTDG